MVRRLDDSSAMETSLGWMAGSKLAAGGVSRGCTYATPREAARETIRSSRSPSPRLRADSGCVRATLPASRIESQLAGAATVKPGAGKCSPGAAAEAVAVRYAGARPALDRFECLDEPGLARGLAVATPRCAPSSPIRQATCPGNHLGGADLIAVVDPDQVVGLAPADSEQPLDGWRSITGTSCR